MLHRFRQNTEFLWEESWIVTAPNGYKLNDNLNIVINCQQFEDYCQVAEKETGNAEKIELWKKTVNTYGGSIFL